MPVTVEITAGPHTGEVIEIPPDQTRSFGRGRKADCGLPQDKMLSGVHFEIAFDGRNCLIRDLKSANGTFVNGKEIRHATLETGQEIGAGQSKFLVEIQDDLVARDRAARNRLVRTLARSQPLYAILDAARSPAVLELLSGAKERFQCLYNGESAAKLAACAPYLVQLPEHSRLLGKLVRRGWGEAWGVYLVSEAPFDDLRKHLRHFLKVKTEDDAGYYFRFYDPRVLRIFLPTCTAEQSANFFGPIRSYLVEQGEGVAYRDFVAGATAGPIDLTKPR